MQDRLFVSDLKDKNLDCKGSCNSDVGSDIVTNNTDQYVDKIMSR